MNKITENEIELFAIELLVKLGYTYIYAPELSRNYEEVLLKERLVNALETINPSLSYSTLQDAVKQIQRITSSELLSDNETFHKLLVEGVKVDVQHEGVTRGEIVRLVDFDTVGNNDFVVANQFTIIENGHQKRPDMILFVNGLPFVVIELKNAVDENATIKSAYNQIETYKALIPSLFTYNAFYSAVANNKSAKELMSKEILRELAVAITESVRRDAVLDWKIKESARANLKKNVKRILTKFGYPPDMQLLATETVLKQAEMIANELVEERK